jgi:hypothetical protein
MRKGREHRFLNRIFRVLRASKNSLGATQKRPTARFEQQIESLCISFLCARKYSPAIASGYYRCYVTQWISPKRICCCFSACEQKGSIFFAKSVNQATYNRS